MNDFDKAALSEHAAPGGPVAAGGTISQSSPYAADNFPASAFLSREADGVSLGTPMPPAFEVRVGDCLRLLREMPSDSVQCAVTSPPYWNLRDYGVNGQLSREATPAAYVAKMVGAFR